MRDFSWKYFTLTGDVDAYMLYKDMQAPPVSSDSTESTATDENEETDSLD